MGLLAHVLAHSDWLANIQQPKGVNIGWGCAGRVPGFDCFPAKSYTANTDFSSSEASLDYGFTVHLYIT